MNQAHSQFCQLGGFGLIVCQDIMKLLFSSRPNPDGHRNYADSFGKQANKFLQRTGPMCGLDVSEDPSPTLEHLSPPSGTVSAESIHGKIGRVNQQGQVRSSKKRASSGGLDFGAPRSKLFFSFGIE